MSKTITKTRAPKALKTREQILIGPTTYCHSKSVMRFGRYVDGSIAIQCYTTKGEPTFKPTVCVDEPAPEGYVWLKGWSENEGVIDALVKAGVVSITGKARVCGYGYAIEGRLLV